MIFSDDLILGIIIGIFITCLATYLLLEEMSQHSFSRSLIWFTKRFPRRKTFILPTSIVKTTTGYPANNSNKLIIRLDIKKILPLLQYYQSMPNLNLFQQIRTMLHQHSADGGNYLHEYLAEYYLEDGQPRIEVVEQMLKIEPHLLYETDAEGNSPLHVAEQNRHVKIAEFLIQKRHFKNFSYRYEYLRRTNRYGFTALHNAAYLWRYNPEHLLNMIKRYPLDCLFWKDTHGRQVYELFVDHSEENRKKMMDIVKYKILTEQNHIEIPSERIDQIREENGLKSYGLVNLKELWVNKYTHFLGAFDPPIIQVSPSLKRKLRKRVKLKKPETTKY